MNTVRSCNAVSAMLLLFTVAGSNIIVFAAVAKDTTNIVRVCCPGVSDSVCRYANRTFHTVGIIGGSGDEKCPVPYGFGTDAPQLIRKCCPPDRAYDPETRYCRVADDGSDSATDFQELMMTMLLPQDRTRDKATVFGLVYGPPTCHDGDVLIDVVSEPTTVGSLLTDDFNCLDVTPQPTRQLVTRKCRPNVQYCGEGGGRYTCANKCCKGYRMIGAE